MPGGARSTGLPQSSRGSARSAGALPAGAGGALPADLGEPPRSGAGGFLYVFRAVSTAEQGGNSDDRRVAAAGIAPHLRDIKRFWKRQAGRASARPA